MAITLADFTKIWASTSPLTPYSFSDANYQEGWNFIGSTPPARQMWDSIQKTNDEKLKYIVDNFLPLSGGTMTGDITLADGGNPLSTAGGTMTGAIVGNPLTLTADDGNGNVASLVANPNGTATWDGDIVQTSKVYSATLSLTSEFELYNSSNPAMVNRIGNVVQVIAVVKPTSTLAVGEHTICTLPLGYRPISQVYEIKQGSSMTRWFLQIETGGAVKVSRYGTTSESTIASGQWLPFSSTFITSNSYPSS